MSCSKCLYFVCSSQGDKFHIGQFHYTVLRNGALPLDVLETVIDDWIATGGDETNTTDTSKSCVTFTSNSNVNSANQIHVTVWTYLTTLLMVLYAML